MPDSEAGGTRGLFDSLTILAGTLTGVVATRLELLSLDLEEERAHLVSILLWSVVAFFCIGIGAVLATILLVIIFWDTQRTLALGVIAGCYFITGIVACLAAVHAARSKPGLFAGSLSELSKDRAQLMPGHE